MGRRSIDETNKIRASLGLAVVPKAKRANTSILTNEKKARSQEILATMLTKKGKTVVQRIMEKALNDDDPDQMACLKICADRMIPTSYFEKDRSGNKSVTIQITGIGQAVVTEDEVVEGETVDG